MRKAGLCLAALMLLFAGCGSSKATKASDIVGTVTTSGISADRCAANKAAGEITYLTGFDFAASAGIIDAVMADQLGYFNKMCLNVKVQSGFDTSNIPLVSAGKAQFTAVGSVSEVADAAAKSGNIEAIAVLGHRAVEEVAVSDKANVAKPSDLNNTTMGVQGTIPFSIRVMLVKDGVNLASLKQVDAGFNPIALDQGTFASRPVYKSNEPHQLDAANVKYHVFDPAAEGVAASFGAITVNKDFAEKYPTATEDFLRAQLYGLKYAIDNPVDAVTRTYKKADPKYYLSQDGEQFRWNTEAGLVKDSTPANQPFGYIDPSQVTKELDPLVTQVKALPAMPSNDAIYDQRFIERVYSKTNLIWPTN